MIILSLYYTAKRRALSCPPQVEHIKTLLDLGRLNVEAK